MDLTTAAFTLKLGDGTTVRSTLKLSHVLPANSDIDAAWSSVSGDSSSPPCDIDASRDAVLVGSIAFSNQTPSFTPGIDLQFQENAGSGVVYSLGVGYSSAPECDDFSQYPNQGDIKPDFEGSDWGPVPIEIVVHNYFSPANPNGDASLLGDQTFYFGALATGGGSYAFYDTFSQSELIHPTHLNGLTYVQLRQLA